MSVIGVILNTVKTTLFSVMEGRRCNKGIFGQNNNIFKNYIVFSFTIKGITGKNLNNVYGLDK